jgi:hypothetical protein
VVDELRRLWASSSGRSEGDRFRREAAYEGAMADRVCVDTDILVYADDGGSALGVSETSVDSERRLVGRRLDEMSPRTRLCR